MKIAYVIPRMSGEGGVQRVMALKANYWVQNNQAEVHLITHDASPSFYPLDPKIQFHHMELKGNRLNYFIQYCTQVKALVAQIQPDVLIVCDGFKGFFLPFWIRKIPCWFESHGSYYNQVFQPKQSVIKTIQYRIELALKRQLAMRFDAFIVLSEASAQEWSVPNSHIIPNPNWVIPSENSTRSPEKIAIVIARHSYEKGIDRLLPIWQQFVAVNPDWQLHIYGSGSATFHQSIASDLGISSSVFYFEPVADLTPIYQKAGMFLMTSRYEGLPMSLIEALSFGVPSLAYDCPVGPRALLNSTNGFLIQDNAAALFLEAMQKVASGNYDRVIMTHEAQKSVQRFEKETVMKQWQKLFQQLIP
ncbi:MAG: hypothetical protein RL607_658 [Bacteroidota bacterium]